MEFTLSLDGNITELQNYLIKQRWIDVNEEILAIDKPGEGNMNVVVRVKTNKRSIIVKQARAFVQKYPDISAPIERIAVENSFYELVSQIDFLKNSMPKRIGFDADNFVMALQDLGQANDFTNLYKKCNAITDETIGAATTYLSVLHNHSFSEATIATFSNNMALRKLNYEHLFVYPLMPENGFDLDVIQSGLQGIAMKYKTDEKIAKKMLELGDVYLSSGNALLHGDFYPGSWLNANNTLKIIDPEFCFFGMPEYDLGVMIAHLKMMQATDNQTSIVWNNYRPKNKISKKLTNQFVGMELIRRIIGLAQLPLELTLSEKENLLNEARNLLLDKSSLFA